MKNLILLFVTAAIMVSCNSNEERKMKIDQKIDRLYTKINKGQTQRAKLVMQMERMTFDYESKRKDLPHARQINEEIEFHTEMNKIQHKQRQLEIQEIRYHLEIRKLMEKYAKL
jgi:hypothetical protein